MAQPTLSDLPESDPQFHNDDLELNNDRGDYPTTPRLSFNVSGTSSPTLRVDLEDGFDARSRRSDRRRRHWIGKWIWDIMNVRSRRKGGIELDGYRDTDGLLDDEHVERELSPQQKVERRKRTWYNYCIFGGISGCTVLAILFLINLLLTLATLFWDPVSTFDYLDPLLANWGSPNTGTESLAWYPTSFLRDVQPIPCHSHNDYWRRVPLFSALRAGCISVEADVWVFNSEKSKGAETKLFVGHNTASLTQNRTFQSLYINPIVKILEDQNPNTEFYNGTSHGVFDVDPGQSLTLLVDLKTSGKETWPEVLKQLQPLRERGWLSYVENGVLHPRPVTVVGTGNTPFDLLTANSTYRDVFFDAPLETMWEPRHSTPETSSWPDLDDSLPGERLFEDEGSDSSPPPSTSDLGQGLSGVSPTTKFTPLNSYYASVSFGSSIGKIWRGRLSPRQMRLIRGQVRGAHQRGLKVRYWDLPSWPRGVRDHVWGVLVREGVDVLNVDDLRGVRRGGWGSWGGQ